MRPGPAGRRLLRAEAVALGLFLALACSAPTGVRTVHPALEPGDTDAASGYEVPPVLRASQLWPAELLVGEHYAVQEQVPTDGFARIYTIESDFGTFEALGDDMLRTRVHEIRALAVLDAMSGRRDFAAAAARGLGSPFVATWNLIRHPVDSVIGIPRTAWQEIQRTAQLAGAERGEFESRAFQEFIGFEAEKRELARHLGVDPYSSNKVLQRELNRFAWASFAGGLPFRLIPFTEGPKEREPTASASDETGELLLLYSPEDLRRLNRIQLAVLGVPRESADGFLANPWFSPRRQTLLIQALADLDGARNAAALLDVAATAQSEYDALFYQRSAELLRAYAYDGGERRIERLVALRSAVGGVTPDGTLVVPLLVDHAVWTQPASQLCRGLAERARRDFGVERIEFLLTGTLSAKASAELEALDIRVVERAFDRLEAARAETARSRP